MNEDDTARERLAFSPEDAARVLGLGRTTIYRMVRAGDLPARRCGTRVLISRRALEEYLDGQDG